MAVKWQLRTRSVRCRYPLVLLQTSNALFMLRCCIKGLVQTLTEDNVVQQFAAHTGDANAPVEQGVVVIETLVNSLIETIVDVKLTYESAFYGHCLRARTPGR